MGWLDGWMDTGLASWKGFITFLYTYFLSVCFPAMCSIQKDLDQHCNGVYGWDTVGSGFWYFVLAYTAMGKIGCRDGI